MAAMYYVGHPMRQHMMGFQQFNPSLPNTKSIDSAFGSTRLLIFVYLWTQERQRWDLLLTRQTNTSKISVKYSQQSKEIRIFSKAGKGIVTLPIDGLNFKFDPDEQ